MTPDQQELLMTQIHDAVETGPDGYTDGKHRLTVSNSGHELKVRDLKSGFLVAYSSSRADYDQSLEEFASDFFFPESAT